MGIRRELIQEFGTGKEAREQRKEFLKAHDGIRGLREIRDKEGSTGLKQKIGSFKTKNQGRPGQKPENKPDAQNKPDSLKNPLDKKEDLKPDANKEWVKKDDERLSKLKEDPKQFKEFEARTKTDGIKEINETFDKKDLAKLRGIVDKALDGQKLSPQERLAALGFADKEQLVLAGKADKDGIFALYKAKDTKNPFAKITIGERGDFKYENIDDKTKEKENPLSKNIRTLEEVRNNPEVYKKFEGKSKAETIKAMEAAMQSNNLPELRGMMDSALSQTKVGKQSSSEQIRDFIGFSKTGDFKMISKPDKDGNFYLADAKKPTNKTHMQIQGDGSFKEKIN